MIGPPTRSISPFFLKLSLSLSATLSSGVNGSLVSPVLHQFDGDQEARSLANVSYRGVVSHHALDLLLEVGADVAAFSTMFSVSIISMFFRDAAADTGCPLDVRTCCR